MLHLKWNKGLYLYDFYDIVQMFVIREFVKIRIIVKKVLMEETCEFVHVSQILDVPVPRDGMGLNVN